MVSFYGNKLVSSYFLEDGPENAYSINGWILIGKETSRIIRDAAFRGDIPKKKGD